MKNKTLIFGQPKTATTYLYYKIKKSNSIFTDDNCLFEPMENNITDNTILVKALNNGLSASSIDFTQSPFNAFEKRIFINRDPRDRFISSFFYLSGFYWPSSNDRFDDLIGLLKQKETDSSSVSFKDLVYSLYGKDKLAHFIKMDKQFIEVHKKNSHYRIRYSDIIDDNFENLEEYLGYRITDDKNPIHENLIRVIRTKKGNNWRDWFLSSDVEYFKNMFLDYMNYFDYDIGDWCLNSPQILDPSHGSEYVIKLRRESTILTAGNNVFQDGDKDCR